MTSARLRRWHRLWHHTRLQHRLLSAELRLRHKIHSILHDSESQEADDPAASSLDGMSMRCDVCSRFRLHQTNTKFHKSSTTVDDMNNFARLSELRKQASAGCPVCAGLAEAVKAVLPSDTTRKRSLGITRRSPKDERETLRFLVIDRQPFGRDEALQLADFEIFAAKGHTSPYKSIPVKDVRLPRHFGDNECFQKVRDWMSRCQQTHAACPSSKPPALPTRVVQVSADANGLHCKLHISSKDEYYEYLALSHCWGDPNKIPKTEQASLERYQEEVPLQALSQTFKDAMRITAELGYRFIWIDALCIMQDDDDDWEREATKMAAIYGNASLTIAAASSSDGSGGCLYDRRGGTVIPLTRSEALDSGLTAHEALSHSLFSSLVTSTQQSSSNSPNPLVLRKWCYQERILSPRILYYSFDEMLWECRQTIECECGNPGEIHTIGAKAGSSKVTFDSLLYSPDMPCDAASERWNERALRAWRIMVEAYSKARLSYETDVLPALAGVAERFASASLGKYVAGLWTDPFLNLLSWRSKPSGTSAHTRPTAYCAPTWSWAAIQGQITFHEDFASKDFDPEIISVSRTLATDYEYGRITDAALVLNARALFHKVTKCKPGFDWLVGETALYQRVTFAGLKETFVLNLDTEQDGVDLKGKTICLLCVYKRKAVSTSDVDASFLLLVEAEDRNTFRRVGILTDDGTGADGGLCALIEDAPRRDFTIC